MPDLKPLLLPLLLAGCSNTTPVTQQFTEFEGPGTSIAVDSVSVTFDEGVRYRSVTTTTSRGEFSQETTVSKSSSSTVATVRVRRGPRPKAVPIDRRASTAPKSSSASIA